MASRNRTKKLQLIRRLLRVPTVEPLGTSIGEGRAAVNAARKYKRVVQIGTQQRSWPHYQQAAEVIRSGQLAGGCSLLHDGPQ